MKCGCLLLKMLNFLKQSRKFLNSPGSTIVIGNESCDLDSAVCAVSLAYFYNKYETSARNYLPVLNMPRRDYPLKTEVKYIFNQYHITEDMLTFRDELNDEFLGKSSFILVDHHASPFAAKCQEIYDHRPRDPSATFPDDCKVNLGLVGSCATLIAEYAMQKVDVGNLPQEDAEPLQLLRSTIVLDTVNFSESAGRTTQKDIDVTAHLEDILKKGNHPFTERAEEFERLRVARADMSTLTPLQILRKDLKIIGNAKERIALPGFPMRVQDFIKLSGAEQAVREFAQETQTAIVLLMGMYVDEGDNNRVHRDLGLILIDTAHSDLYATIEDLLRKDSQLQLKHLPRDLLEGQFYQQENVKVTRKYVLPIIKQELDRRACPNVNKGVL